MKKKSMKERARRRLLVLPLLVVPFLALGFYALDGGKGAAGEREQGRPGLNTSLPAARFEKSPPRDKLEFYRRAQQLEKAAARAKKRASVAALAVEGAPSEKERQGAAQVKVIRSKLEAIQREISRPAAQDTIGERRPLVEAGETAVADDGMAAEVDRLEGLMRVMQQKDTTVDAETAQLNAMLERILDIQHPQRVERRLAKEAARRPPARFQAIPAMVSGRQKVVDGGMIELELRDSVRLNGVMIPKGHRLFGTCRFVNRRVLAEVENVRVGRLIVPVDLTVYSLDGMPGIAARSVALTEAAGRGMGDAARSIGLYGMDPSLGAQVAGAGLEAAKSFLGKKVRKVTVKLQDGEPVLLRNNVLAR